MVALFTSLRPPSASFLLHLLLHLEYDLPQFRKIDDVRLWVIALGLARYHHCGREKGDHVEGLLHPPILRPPQRTRYRTATQVPTTSGSSRGKTITPFSVSSESLRRKY